MSFALVLSVVLSQASVDAGTPTDAAAPSSPETDRASLGAGTQLQGSIQTTTEIPWWQRVTIGGFARLGVFYTFPLADEQLVGGNGGFRLADFRISLDFHPIEKFSAKHDGAKSVPLGLVEPPVTRGNFVLRLRKHRFERRREGQHAAPTSTPHPTRCYVPRRAA